MYWIDREQCAGCMACAEACAVPDAIIVRRGKPMIDTDVCTECGVCAGVCPQGAIALVAEAHVSKTETKPERDKDVAVAATDAPAVPELVEATDLRREAAPQEKHDKATGRALAALGLSLAEALLRASRSSANDGRAGTARRGNGIGRKRGGPRRARRGW